MAEQSLPEREQRRLESDDGLVYFDSLYCVQDEVFAAIGRYMQLAAYIDFKLRRIYFALLHHLGRGEKERGGWAQIIERLPRAIAECDVDLYRKDELPRLLEVISDLLQCRNDVAHSPARWQPDGDFLIFVHANRDATGNPGFGELVWWVIPKGNFLGLVASLEGMCRFLTQYEMTWLPVLRPDLPTFVDGELREPNEAVREARARMEQAYTAAVDENGEPH